MYMAKKIDYRLKMQEMVKLPPLLSSGEKLKLKHKKHYVFTLHSLHSHPSAATILCTSALPQHDLFKKGAFTVTLEVFSPVYVY